VYVCSAFPYHLVSCEMCMQAIGMSSTQDRDMLKKHIKSLKTSIENEKKLRTREQKEREKQAKKKTAR